MNAKMRIDDSFMISQRKHTKRASSLSRKRSCRACVDVLRDDTGGLLAASSLAGICWLELCEETRSVLAKPPCPSRNQQTLPPRLAPRLQSAAQSSSSSCSPLSACRRCDQRNGCRGVSLSPAAAVLPSSRSRGPPGCAGPCGGGHQLLGVQSTMVM